MKILFIEPNEDTFYSFRKELLDKLLEQKNELFVVAGFSNRIEKDYSKIAKLYNVSGNLRSLSILSNLKLIKTYDRIIKEVEPDVILTFTIKPNIYCNLKKRNAYTVANITGLGTAFNKNNLLQKIIVKLYKKSFKNVDHIMFQNQNGIDTFKKLKIPMNNYSLIPGSGVNENKFTQCKLDEHNGCKFLYASRFIKEKGIDLLFEAIPVILNNYKDASFTFVGLMNKKYSKKANKLISSYGSRVTFSGRTNDIASIIKKNDFLVSPSYYKEGMSNILLESLACGRPIITTEDNPGCKEIIQNNINGYSIFSKDLDSLIKALSKACETSKEDIEKMGLNGRKFVIKNFNRNATIGIYIDVLNQLH